MKIGFISSEFFHPQEAPGGGLANYLYRLSKILVSRGHEVHVFYAAGVDKSTWVMEGIVVHRLRFKRGRWLNYFNHLTRWYFQWSLQCLIAAYRLDREVQEEHSRAPFDVIQVSNYQFPGLFTVLFRSVSTVVRASSYSPLWNKFDEQKSTFDLHLVEKLENMQMRSARSLFAPSKFLARTLEREIGTAPVDVLETPFYHDVPALNQSWWVENLSGKDYFLYFGAIMPRKGLRYLVACLPEVLTAFPEAHAVLIGPQVDLSFSQSLKEYVHTTCPGVEKRIIFQSGLDHARLYPVILQARLVVLPSLVDNSPNALLEAMALAKPVIGTTGTSLDEYITDEVSGFLVPPGDSAALGIKIMETWPRDDLQEIGDRARKVINERVSNDEIIDKLLSYYQSVITQ